MFLHFLARSFQDFLTCWAANSSRPYTSRENTRYPCRHFYRLKINNILQSARYYNKIDKTDLVKRLVNSRFFKKVQKTCTRDFERNNLIIIGIPNLNSLLVQLAYSLFSYFPPPKWKTCQLASLKRVKIIFFYYSSK